MNERECLISDAIWYLKRAREKLDLAATPYTLEKVHRAIKSAEGAQRHARGNAPKRVQRRVKARRIGGGVG
jgi:hypothetical protein